ncbi:MAG: gliding motility-associated C-terminal domain-containing protein [Chitinophagales bacterium]|nr:gliding motility-associated C-terminal domain-containing protein [Chitinophagales bacterium]
MRTDLSVINSFITNIVDSFCNGDSVFVGGTFHTQAGIYFDTLPSSGGCDSMVITELILIDINVISENNVPITIERGDTVNLSVTTNANSPNYLWRSPNWLDCVNCSNPNAWPPEDHVFTVIVTDESGCLDSTRIQVLVRNDFDPNDCFTSIYVPNAFTPNGDGVNDVFYVYGNGIEELHLIVADRWGNIVFESFDLNSGWDGTHRGVLMSPDVFVYYVEVTFCNGSKMLYSSPYRKGSVTLIR